MRGSRRDEETVAGAQDDGGTSLDLHLDLASDDVADLFAGMNVPSGLDACGNLRLHLHDLAAWDRRRRALDHTPDKLAGQIVARLG